MGRQALLKRIEQAEETVKGLSRDQPSQFDEDALAIYSVEAYLDATMEPTYHEVEPTAAYARGKELRDALYGPIIPAHVDEHIKRYTRASGEFELAFGREPRVGDILRYEHLKLMHSSENYSREFGSFIQAWQRQLPQLTCPLKFEDGRLFRRLRPEGRGEEPKWEEDVRIHPEERWHKWHKKAADQGHPIAQYHAGALLCAGQGVQQNLEEGIRLFQAASQAGLVAATVQLGVAYATGASVTRDSAKGMTLLRQAAQSGSAEAECFIALMYQTGRGVEQDDTESVAWYRRAAEHRHPYAQNALGFHLQVGKGVEKNPAEALKGLLKYL